MRSILITVLLIITVLVIYSGITEGDGGTRKQMEQSGGAMSEAIRRLSP